VLDSGSAFDIVGRSSLSRSATKRIVTSPCPPQLITANGRVDADKVLPLELKNAGITTNALVLEDSPSVLSLGKRCLEEGYSFVWPAHGEPVLTRPDGRKVKLVVHQNVPML
jgi:hypothetical protein